MEVKMVTVVWVVMMMGVVMILMIIVGFPSMRELKSLQDGGCLWVVSFDLAVLVEWVVGSRACVAAGWRLVAAHEAR